jgi:Myb/SANT-like DNA-binding domain
MAKKDRSKIKASWNKHVVHTFCDLCIREIEIGNRPGLFLNKKGWRNVMSKFAKETGREYDRIQLKSKWDMMKKDWKQWKLLLENETEIKWNSRKNTIDASNDWWEQKIKVLIIQSIFVIILERNLISINIRTW